MSEGSLYDREIAALAIKQARGDLIEAIFLARAYRTTLPRFGFAEPLDTKAMALRRRVSATFKDLPGGQVLGPTFDYTHRLIDFALAESPDPPPPATAPADAASPTPRVVDIIAGDDLIEKSPPAEDGAPVADVTRDPTEFPAAATRGCRRWRAATRASCSASAIRPSAATAATTRSSARSASARSRSRCSSPSSASPFRWGRSPSPNARWSTSSRAGDGEPARFTRGYGLVFGQSERKAMSMALVDRALRADELAEERIGPAQDAEFVLSHCDNVQATGFVEHLKLPHYVDFQAELALLRELRRGRREARRRPARKRPPNDRPAYNFAYLDEQTKRMIRRAILKAIAIPGYQVPFASREMPMPYGWGTGGVQVTAAIIGPDDVLKVIDQGADDTTNAVSIRAFFAKTADVATTTDTTEATIIQTRHRVPETPLTGDQILVYQVPIPEPLRFLEPRETETRTMHALAEYGVMHVKLYEDIARHGHIATTYAYPARVADRYIMDPSPIPKVRQSQARRLSGAAIVRRRAREAHLRHPAAHARRLARFRGPPVRAHQVRRGVRVLRRDRLVPRRGRHRRQGRKDVRLLRHRLLRKAPRRENQRGGGMTAIGSAILPRAAGEDGRGRSIVGGPRT